MSVQKKKVSYERGLEKEFVSVKHLSTAFSVLFQLDLCLWSGKGSHAVN